MYSYYEQGNEFGSSMEDAGGNKYTETLNEYDGYYLTANAKGQRMKYSYRYEPVMNMYVE